MGENNRSSFGGQDVAVFIDFENIYISVLAEYDVNPDFESIIEKAGEFGRVSVAQAYADWTPYSHYINALHAYEIDPIYVPAYHYGEGGKQKGGAIKNSVDMFLCINAMKMLYSHPNIQTFMLVTGDRDFVPLVKTIREFGKRAVVIGVAGAASSHLAQAADEFFFYHQITDNLKPPEKEKVKARDPYETLAEAVRLARQRGYVATLASLKLLMTELMGEFDQTRYKDARGRPLQKFKDFVKEAERRGKVKVFSTGTINEIFLPNEDPRKTSRFVEEILPPEPPAEEGEEAGEAEEEAKVEVEVTHEQWKLFVNAMLQVDGAVPFVRVFDVLRGLRNQGLLDLSNKELKAMVIKAIHMNVLNRSSRGRGRRTFYQLTADPAVLSEYVEMPVASTPHKTVHPTADMPPPPEMPAPAEAFVESYEPHASIGEFMLATETALTTPEESAQASDMEETPASSLAAMDAVAEKPMEEIADSSPVAPSALYQTIDPAPTAPAGEDESAVNEAAEAVEQQTSAEPPLM